MSAEFKMKHRKRKKQKKYTWEDGSHHFTLNEWYEYVKIIQNSKKP